VWQMKTKGGLCVADEAKGDLRMADKAQRESQIGGLCNVDEAKWRLVCGRRRQTEA
jgi:hypothetical protein